MGLFDDEHGGAVSNSACYLYCRLISDQARKARLWVGSDDSVRIVLNGQVVHRFVGQRWPLENDEQVAVDLKQGPNELPVRVDNYSGDGGFYGRLADADGRPLDSLKVQLNVPAGTADLPPHPTGPPWKEICAKIPPLPPAEHEELFGAPDAHHVAAGDQRADPPPGEDHDLRPVD